MKTELEKQLFDKYPSIFADRTKPMSETCMCWGISCDDGWYHIIDNLCKQLTFIENVYDVKVIADQVKEKYGTLRFYHHIVLGPRWSTDTDGHLLDLKLTTERSSLGWTSTSKMEPVYESVERQIDEWIHVAEYLSGIVCEDCGMIGATQNESGWIKTQCEVCKNK